MSIEIITPEEFGLRRAALKELGLTGRTGDVLFEMQDYIEKHPTASFETSSSTSSIWTPLSARVPHAIGRHDPRTICLLIKHYEQNFVKSFLA
jgi:hypothetical protein